MATESVSYGSENDEQNLLVPVGIIPKQHGWTKSYTKINIILNPLLGGGGARL